MFKKTIKKIIKISFQVINILLVLLTVILAVISIFKKEWIEQFIEWIKVVIE
jgi:hypothetical protein